jgi:hypothetical protein
MFDDATVTVNRPHFKAGAPALEAITCVFARVGGTWVLREAVDEDGGSVTLDQTQRFLAQCLVDSGVDETGRD